MIQSAATACIASARGRHVLALAALTLVIRTSLAAPSPAQKCAAVKVRAAGAAVYAETKCYQRALLAGVSASTTCLATAEQKLVAAFVKAEAAGGCLVMDDAGAIEAAVDACLESFTGGITGDARCSAAKTKAVGRKTYEKARCQRRTFMAGMDPDPACLEKAETKFTAAVAKADSVGTCTDTAVALETLVDACASLLFAAQANTTTTTLGPCPSYPSYLEPCGCGDYVGTCLPAHDGQQYQCVSLAAQSGPCERDTNCTSDYRCVDYTIPFTTTIVGCFADCGDYTCGRSPAPTCDGTCPGGEVCGQLSGTSVCGCARPDNTCSIAQAPACGGTCPIGETCVQAPGRDSCACAPPDDTCGISQAPACGGTCPAFDAVCIPAPEPLSSSVPVDRCACARACAPSLVTWGGSGNGDGQFNGTTGLAVDTDGNVFVADEFNDRIQKFTNTGSFLAKWGSTGTGDGQFNTPMDVAVDGDGNVFVLDFSNYRVQKFTNSGSFLLAFGSVGSGDGQFSFPSGIAVDRAGNVFVADSGNRRIQKFTNNGTFTTKWGGGGIGDGQFLNPPAKLALDGLGNVFVVEPSSERVLKFTNGGEFLLAFGWGVADGEARFETCSAGCQYGRAGFGDGQFNGPTGISVDGGGNVLVADYYNGRVQKFTNSGSFLTACGPPGLSDRPFAIAIDGSGGVFLTFNAYDSIQKFSGP